MKSQALVAVVIPNWNGASLISDCLTSLQNQTLRPHIIVVDNGSTDSSVSLIKKRFAKVELIELPKNTGFTGGVNTGITRALAGSYDYVALLNNDAVADKNWLRQLVAVARSRPKAGIITGKFMRLDKTHFDSTGDFYTTWGLPFPRGRNQVDQGQFDQLEPVFGATGGASLYRVSMLEKVGLFDDDFFAYFEDGDISFRAQLAGWQVWYTPQALAYHHVSATGSRLGSFSRYHSVKNFILLYNKNVPGWLFWKYKPLFGLQLARFSLGALRDGELLVYLRAVLAGIKLLPSTLRKRRQVQRGRRVSVKHIDKLIYHGRPPRPPKLS